MATRVFIYEPQKSFHPKPQTTILASPEVQLVGITDDLDRASYVTRNFFNRIDVMILSCAVTSQTEIDIIRKVRPIRTLLLSHTHDDEAVVAALSAGVGGYMTDGSYSGSLILINQIIFGYIEGYSRDIRLVAYRRAP